MTKSIIEPHGGVLVDCYLPKSERQNKLLMAQSLPQLRLSRRNLADLECLATGLYSPLNGFICEDEYRSIVDHMRLSNGLAWTIPITLQVQETDAERYPLDSKVALTHPNGDILAILTVTSKYRPNQETEAQQVYGTTVQSHPGVKATLTEGSVYLGGPVQ